MVEREKLSEYLKVKTHPNGGATTLHLDQKEFSHLGSKDLNQLTALFFDQLFVPDDDSNHVMGVIHDSIKDLPEFVNFISSKYPLLKVRVNLLNSKEIRTMTLSDYFEQIQESYSFGTFQCGNMNQISLVGCVNEESGGYLEELLELISSNIFIKNSLPWGNISEFHNSVKKPVHSNDGPILWVRSGEQFISIAELSKSRKKNKGSFGYRKSEPRQIFIPDRTNCHVDYAYNSNLIREPTGAAGLLKAVKSDKDCDNITNREVKHALCFHPKDLGLLCNLLQLDLYEPPISQCVQWVGTAKLNFLRRHGIKYSSIILHDNDAYFIPKNVVHQFKTVSSCTSVAWHVRLRMADNILSDTISNIEKVHAKNEKNPCHSEILCNLEGCSNNSPLAIQIPNLSSSLNSNSHIILDDNSYSEDKISTNDLDAHGRSHDFILSSQIFRNQAERSDSVKKNFVHDSLTVTPQSVDLYDYISMNKHKKSNHINANNCKKIKLSSNLNSGTNPTVKPIVPFSLSVSNFNIQNAMTEEK